MTKKKTSTQSPLVHTLTPADVRASFEQSQTVTSLALLFHTFQSRLEVVTAHRVEDGSNGPHLMPGRPLSPADELAIVELLRTPTSETDDAAFLPGNVLIQNRFATLWWRPSEVRPMHLHPANEQHRTISVRWPSLAFLSIARKLYIVGLQDDDRPTPASPVFHAPLANIWNTGQVCTGNAALPLGCSITDIPAWESVVYATGFSHANHDNVIRQPGKRKGLDPMAFWSGRKSKAPIPATHLVPLRTTLMRWAASILEENGA